MKKILINYQPNNTKVCILEDGKLVEFWVERESIERLVGNIYKGKVVNVLPGMEFAFVNIGLERNGFLYAGDILGCEEAKEAAASLLKLKIGDEVLVQVVKDQFGNKGARITMNITLPGRGLVLLPQIDYVGVSRKIVNQEDKDRLIDFVTKNKKPGYGYILRTQALSCTEDELLQEMDELISKWERIQSEYIRKPAKTLIYKDESLAVRAIRDMLRSDVDEVIVNDERILNELKYAFPHIVKEKPNLFKYYSKQDDIIYHYRIDKQISKLLERKVVLKNGAYLVIDRTEALTVIDVNTGKYVGEKDLEQTVFETNKIAAVEIARQLRLRNIGGIIVVDFIDMDNQEHINQVMDVLRESLNQDRTKASLIDMTPLGLVEITRKKTLSMIEDVMLQPCPYCNGDGYVYSDEVMAGIIQQHLNQLFKNERIKSVAITVSNSVFNKIFSYRLLERENKVSWMNKRIYLIPSSKMHVEKFDIKVLEGAVIDVPDEARLLY